jgi:oligoendopeptidase F
LAYKFTTDATDWTGCEDIVGSGYQKILHFYLAPFYYIEYGFAQLGAIAVLRNFKQDPSKAIAQYKQALSLGYTKPIPVFYETAGAKFDFSKQYIQSLVDFLNEELEKLQ